MRVLFLQARAIDESLALADASALLKADGFQTRLLLTGHERGWVQRLRAEDPGLIVIQAAFMAEPWLRAAVDQIGPMAPTVLVGTAATFDDDLLLRVPARWALQGEIDDSLLSLARVVRDGGEPLDVPGLVCREGSALRRHPWGQLPDELGARPLPDRALYFDAYPFLGRFPWKRLATGRGCVHACGFCYLPPLRERYGGERPNVRRKPVQRVIDEALTLRERWPLRRVHFADDLFAPSRPWLEELAERWPAEVGVPFSCSTSPETITDHNAFLLARAGARVVGIGLETGVERNRLERLGRPTRDEQIRRAAGRLRSHGIELLTFNMIANPGERFDEAMQTVVLNQEIGTTFARANLAYPAPQSWMEQALRASGAPLPDPASSERGDRRAWCAEGPPAPFENLARLFRWGLRWKVPPAVLAAICEQVPTPLLTPMVLYDAWVEARWSGVPLVDMVRYGARAGLPTTRVTYHESIA